MPKDLGQPCVGLDLGIQPVDVAGLEQGLHPEPVGQQFQLAIPGFPSEADHLLGRGQALLQVLRGGDGVAERAEGVGHGGGIPHPPGHGHRLAGHLGPAFLGSHERQGHCEARHHPSPEGRVLLRQRLQSLLEQVDLSLVEQPDLEPSQPGA